MTTSGLAFSVLTLVATLAALDLSTVHAPPAPQTAAAQMSVIRTDQSAPSGDIEMRLIKPAIDGEDAVPAFAINGPAIHRCVTTDNAGLQGPAQYCFGAPAPEIIYD